MERLSFWLLNLLAASGKTPFLSKTIVSDFAHETYGKGAFG
jgi:hypothetical protein